MSLLDNLLAIGSMSESHERKAVRAAFRMSGAKTRLLPELMPVLEAIDHDKWVDHCGGTGVVSWNKQPCELMVYNDRHSPVADFYLAMRDHEPRLKAALVEYHPKCRQLWEDARDTWVNEKDPVLRSAKWYYMAVNSVAGKRGHFGIDVKSDRNYLKAGMDAWPKLRTIINRFTIENMDIYDSLTTFDSETTLHYVDPPYVGTDQDTFQFKWDMDDLKKLVARFDTLQGTVAMSHCPHPWLDEQEWDDVHSWKIKSSVSGDHIPMIERLYVKGQG